LQTVEAFSGHSRHGVDLLGTSVDRLRHMLRFALGDVRVCLPHHLCDLAGRLCRAEAFQLVAQRLAAGHGELGASVVKMAFVDRAREADLAKGEHAGDDIEQRFPEGDARSLHVAPTQLERSVGRDRGVAAHETRRPEVVVDAVIQRYVR